MGRKQKVGVVIPCFKVGKDVIDVVQNTFNYADLVLVIDDACPNNTADFIKNKFDNKNLIVHKREHNGGVGAAVKDGYLLALQHNMDIIVKMDGDGQMPPNLIPDLIAPIKENKAGYAKGNRFHFIDSLTDMPKKRLFGNSILTLLSRFSSGYWSLSDPTNGFTAISKECLKNLNLEKLSDRFFFESDILFRLNLNKVVVTQLPMKAIYRGESSNLNELSIIPEFLRKHLKNFLKRVFYDYFLRGMSVGSLELAFGVIFLGFGVIFGSINWISNYNENMTTPVGTVMLASFCCLVGIQLLLSFVTFDMMREPKK